MFSKTLPNIREPLKRKSEIIIFRLIFARNPTQNMLLIHLLYLERSAEPDLMKGEIIEICCVLTSENSCRRTQKGRKKRMESCFFNEFIELEVRRMEEIAKSLLFKNTCYEDIQDIIVQSSP